MGGGLDSSTLYASHAVTTVACALVMIVIWRVHGREPAVSLWAMGFIAGALSSVAVFLRPWIPLPISVLGANLFGILSLALLYGGVTRFFGIRAPWRALTLAYVVAITGALYYLFVEVSTAYRILCYLIAATPTLGLMAYHLWIASGPQRSVARFLALGWGLLFVLCIARIFQVSLLMQEGADVSMHSLGLPNTLWLLSLLIVSVQSSIGFLLLASQRLQFQLDDLASRDELTGLLNRRAFYGQARASLQQRPAWAASELLILDVDHFKSVNDRWGHAGGDAVLRALAALLRGQLRSGDLLARAGGEEFWILLPRAGSAEAADVAERLRAAVADHTIALAEDSTRVTISIGHAGLRAEDRDGNLESVLLRADRALYAAKAAGRNRVIRL